MKGFVRTLLLLGSICNAPHKYVCVQMLTVAILLLYHCGWVGVDMGNQNLSYFNRSSTDPWFSDVALWASLCCCLELQNFFQFSANNEEMLEGFNLFVKSNCLEKITWMENWGKYMSKCKERGQFFQKVIFCYFKCICIYILLWHPPCAIVSGTAFARTQKRQLICKRPGGEVLLSCSCRSPM